MSSRAWTPPSPRSTIGARIRDRRERGPGRESFACQFVCAECGWLADSAKLPCPGCTSEAWIDLGHTTTAAMLREHETSTPVLDKRRRRLVNASLAAVFAVSVGLGLALSSITLPVIGSVASLMTGVTLVRSLRQPFAQALEARPDQLQPVRRRLALPPASGLVGRVSGVAVPESSLRTPLGNQPCLAWRVCARLIEADSEGERLLIDDTRSVAFELGGQRFETDGVGVEGEVQRTRLLDLEPEVRERAARFLRERGCFSHEGEWVLEEQWVAASEPVEVEGRGSEDAPVLRRSGEAVADPYRWS